MIFDNSINNILNESKVLENKISNFKSNIDQKDDFLVFEKNQFDLFIDSTFNFIEKILVYPSPRCEQRVYLGTGFRMNEYKKNKNFTNLDYSKSAYKSLKILLSEVNKYWGIDYMKFEEQIIKRGVISPKVLQAFVDVPRHYFVPHIPPFPTVTPPKS